MFVRIPDPLFVPTDEVVKKFLQTVFPRMKSFKSDTIAIYIITDVYTKMRMGHMGSKAGSAAAPRWRFLGVVYPMYRKDDCI